MRDRVRSRQRNNEDPREALTAARTTLAPEQAIERYRDRIREIYLLNGRADTLLTDQITKFDAAVKELLGSLDPHFDPKAFDRVSLVEKINTLSHAFFTHGRILGNFDVTADTGDGGKAILSINLDRVLSKTTIRTGALNFSHIGVTSNPLPETLPFFETTTVIVEAPGSAPLSPLSALTIGLEGRSLPLRSVMGLAYAFERTEDKSTALATVVCNYIGISTIGETLVEKASRFNDSALRSGLFILSPPTT